MSKINSKIIWYMLGCLFNAATSAIVLIITTRINGVYEAGIATFAFTIAQQLLLIGRFEVRTFQVTDAKNEFSFNDYYTHRIIFVIIMIVISVFYIANRDDNLLKKTVIFLFCLFKSSEAISDVFQGFYQKNDMLEKVGRTMVFREGLFMACFSCVLILTSDLIIACACGTAVAFLWVYLYDYRITKKITSFCFRFSLHRFLMLTKACVPIFVSIFAHTYLVNASKYMINRFGDETLQSFYNMLYLPVSVINMLAIIVFFPMMTNLSVIWEKKDYERTINRIKKIVLLIACVSAFVFAIGVLIGIPFLEIVYNQTLTDYKYCFNVLLIGGGCISISGFLNKVLVMLRKQNILIYIYVLCALAEMVISWILTKRYSIYGASIAYVAGTFILMILLGGYLMYYFKRIPIYNKKERK